MSQNTDAGVTTNTSGIPPTVRVQPQPTRASCTIRDFLYPGHNVHRRRTANVRNDQIAAREEQKERYAKLQHREKARFLDKQRI